MFENWQDSRGFLLLPPPLPIFVWMYKAGREGQEVVPFQNIILFNISINQNFSAAGLNIWELITAVANNGGFVNI